MQHSWLVNARKRPNSDGSVHGSASDPFAKRTEGNDGNFSGFVMERYSCFRGIQIGPMAFGGRYSRGQQFALIIETDNGAGIAGFGRQAMKGATGSGLNQPESRVGGIPHSKGVGE